WVSDTINALGSQLIVQPFTEAVRLERGECEFKGTGDLYRSFGACWGESGGAVSGDFAAHGHTGFAWAARRDVIESIGFYDVSLTGSGDHLMAHAFVGDLSSKCVSNMVGPSGPLHTHFLKWGERASTVVRGRIGAVP